MKTAIIIVLWILGAYWLFDHYYPLPLNHESLGLYEHTIHKTIGIVLIVLGVFFAWLWKMKKKN